eukprot:gene12430-8525_t
MIEEMALEQLLCFPCDLLEQLGVCSTFRDEIEKSRLAMAPRSHKKSAPIRLYPSHLSMRRLSVSLYREIQTIIIGTPTNTTQLPPPKK